MFWVFLLKEGALYSTDIHRLQTLLTSVYTSSSSRVSSSSHRWRMLSCSAATLIAVSSASLQMALRASSSGVVGLTQSCSSSLRISFHTSPTYSDSRFRAPELTKLWCKCTSISCRIKASYLSDYSDDVKMTQPWWEQPFHIGTFSLLDK